MIIKKNLLKIKQVRGEPLTPLELAALVDLLIFPA